MANGYPLRSTVSGEWVSIASGLCNECLSIAKGCPLWFAVHGKWLSMTSSCPWQSAVLGKVPVRINRMFISSRCPQQVALFACRVAVCRELLFVVSSCPSGYNGEWLSIVSGCRKRSQVAVHGNRLFIVGGCQWRASIHCEWLSMVSGCLW